MSPQRIVFYAVRHRLRTVGFVVALVGVAGAVGWAVSTSDKAETASSDARKSSQVAAAASRSASAAVAAVQAERRRATRAACLDRNARNRRALRYLRGLSRTSPSQQGRSPAEQRKVLREFTDAVVGKRRNCSSETTRVAPSNP